MQNLQRTIRGQTNGYQMEMSLKKATLRKTKVGGTHQVNLPLVNYMYWVILSLLFRLLLPYRVTLLQFFVRPFENRFTEIIRRAEDK